MSWWETFILGIIQGASEFLPISSSGHLLLIERLGVGEENLFFNIMLHVGTLLAVLIVMRKEWTPLLKRPFQKKNGYILLACIPTVVMAIVFKKCFPSLINGSMLALGFMLTACLLIASEKLIFTQPRLNNAKTSVLTGILQGIAVLPGISRSGATISAMRLLGVDKEEAASFSFLLSIPIILGSALFECVSLIKDGAKGGAPFALNNGVATSIGGVEIFPLLLGVAAAFLSGLIAIKFFLRLIKSKSLTGFAVYDALLAVAVLVLIGIGK